MSEDFERKKLDFIRRGDSEKAKWLENMHKTILPSCIKRIQQNDRTVLKEIVVPKWVSWDLLREWAQEQKTEKGKRCIFCSDLNEVGIDFKNKFVCDSCFLKIKTLQ